MSDDYSEPKDFATGYENFPFDQVPDDEHPFRFICKCGSDTFKIEEPESFHTVATCTSCGKRGLIAVG